MFNMTIPARRKLLMKSPSNLLHLCFWVECVNVCEKVCLCVWVCVFVQPVGQHFESSHLGEEIGTSLTKWWHGEPWSERGTEGGEKTITLSLLLRVLSPRGDCQRLLTVSVSVFSHFFQHYIELYFLLTTGQLGGACCGDSLVSQFGWAGCRGTDAHICDNRSTVGSVWARGGGLSVRATMPVRQKGKENAC